jgi:hypothetical protein
MLTDYGFLLLDLILLVVTSLVGGLVGIVVNSINTTVSGGLAGFITDTFTFVWNTVSFNVFGTQTDYPVPLLVSLWFWILIVMGIYLVVKLIRGSG